jgi:hypothetical protein
VPDDDQDGTADCDGGRAGVPGAVAFAEGCFGLACRGCGLTHGAGQV